MLAAGERLPGFDRVRLDSAAVVGELRLTLLGVERPTAEASALGEYPFSKFSVPIRVSTVSGVMISWGILLL